MKPGDDGFRYGAWAGNKGRPADPRRCIAVVYPGAGFISAQCSRNSGHCKDGRYCKQHAKRHPDA